MDGINTYWQSKICNYRVVIPLQMDGINTNLNLVLLWHIVVIPLQMDGINTKAQTCLSQKTCCNPPTNGWY